MEKQNKPKLRFSSFTDSWEQRKLSDFGRATGGTSIESEFSENGIYKVISIGSYSEDNIYRDQGIRALDSDKTKDRVLNRGDLTMILNDKTSSGNIIGRVLLIEESGVYVYNQRTERIEVDHEKYDSAFIYEMLNAPAIRDKIIKQSQGNTQIYVNWPAVSMTDYYIPRLDEQKKIGEYFLAIDNLVSLHQRKCDQFELVKKAMLQKMFPKEGESVPEIRFTGFTGPWEQRKLGDTVSLRGRIGFRGYTQADLVEKGNGAITFSPADIDDAGNVSQVDNKYISWMKYEESPEIKVQPGDILFTKTASIGKVGFVRYLKEKATINPQFALLTPLKGTDGYFTFLAVRTDMFMKQVRDITGGSSVPTMSQEKLKELTFMSPSLEEQKKIGEFFENLDNLITLHQRKCNELKELKKGLLQQMFI